MIIFHNSVLDNKSDIKEKEVEIITQRAQIYFKTIG